MLPRPYFLLLTDHSRHADQANPVLAGATYLPCWGGGGWGRLDGSPTQLTRGKRRAGHRSLWPGGGTGVPLNRMTDTCENIVFPRTTCIQKHFLTDCYGIGI